MGLLTVGVVSDFCACSWYSFSPIALPCLTVFYFVLFVCSLVGLLFYGEEMEGEWICWAGCVYGKWEE